MTLRRLAFSIALLVCVARGSASAANYETTNFSVSAPSPELAQKFGEQAELFRREKAIAWLGKEMPNWPQRCPLRVDVQPGQAAGGATTFTFGSAGNRSVVSSQSMHIHGNLKQLLNSVLPHEVTHTVLAHHFGRPVPRWADEGGSVLSENDEERYSHDVKCRELLNGGRGIQLRVLFKMTEYPRDMQVLYAQGYSVTDYLVKKGGDGQAGRARLLQFLNVGMAGNTAETWNDAARRAYGFESVDEMQTAWLEFLRSPPAARTAARGNGSAAVPAARPTGETVAAARSEELRTSSPPPSLGEPERVIARGAPPDAEPVNPPVPEVRRIAPDYPRPTLGPPELPARPGSP